MTVVWFDELSEGFHEGIDLGHELFLLFWIEFIFVTIINKIY
jgi:hypothetical protein